MKLANENGEKVKSLHLGDYLAERIAMFEQRTGISVRDYMGFGKTTKAALKYAANGGYHLLGELN